MAMSRGLSSISQSALLRLEHVAAVAVLAALLVSPARANVAPTLELKDSDETGDWTGALRSCFANHPVDGVYASGKVWLEFVMQPDGVVTEAGISRPAMYVGTDLDSCVREVLLRIEFDAAGRTKPARVHYPLIARPPGTGAAANAQAADTPAGTRIEGPDESLEILTESLLDEAVGSHATVQRCLTEAKARGVVLVDTIWLEFRVAPDGDVSRTYIVTPEHASSPMDSCVSAQINQLVFPPFAGDGPATVMYPLVSRYDP